MRSWEERKRDAALVIVENIERTIQKMGGKGVESWTLSTNPYKTALVAIIALTDEKELVGMVQEVLEKLEKPEVVEKLKGALPQNANRDLKHSTQKATSE